MIRLADYKPEERLLQDMRDLGLPITRDNYIAANWGGDVPDPWTAEAGPSCRRISRLELVQSSW
jgi:hypothetical protein